MERKNGKITYINFNNNEKIGHYCLFDVEKSLVDIL